MFHKKTTPEMENPFAIIDARLSVIEGLLIDIKHTQPANAATDNTTAPAARKVVTLKGLCEARPEFREGTVYKLSSQGEIPCSKRGRRLYFDLDVIDAWLLSNQRGTRADAERKADEFLMNATRRARQG